eukprot:gb/GECG01015808.1/.p1 GENE.gb/GECG01015808.1/~~gb/GECG01015808.1/.p1  ORF type:complete len:1184 (+),score=129.88 gb/GECG01015808.1/:1-3552(+)
MKMHTSAMCSSRALEGVAAVWMTCYLWSSVSLVAGVHVHPQRSLEEAKGNDGLVKGRSCGLSDPSLKKELDTPATRVYQEYPLKLREVDSPRGQRQLDGNFMPIQEAEEQGLTSQIRIRLVWDVIETGDKYDGDVQQCNYIGQSIALPDSINDQNSWTDDPCPSEEFMVHANDEKASSQAKKAAEERFALMKRRTEWAASYWENTLRVKPVDNEIVIDSNALVRNHVELPEEQKVHNNTDLVVIMTARPVPFKSVAGYANCMQRDQYGRCTVGRFNWVPDLFEVTNPNADNNIRSERHTAAHEFAHLFDAVLLGNKDAGTRIHIDENGNTKSFDDIAFNAWDSDHYRKTVAKIKTERVLEVSRKHFDCPSLAGVALEDVPLGAGAHWESRILGPEFMSYGSASGEVYISDLTLAFLEDTNQYIVNYTRGGLFVESPQVPFTLGGPSFLFAGTLKREEPPEPLSPGALTWGRGEGCSFLNESARDWPDRYRCSKHQEYGCTPDNKDSGVCTLKTGWTLNKKFSCGEFDVGTGQHICQKVDDSNCESGDCVLPEMYRYFTQGEVADAFSNVDVDTSGIEVDQLGGFSSSMDYVPIQVRFWNCRDQKAATNGSSRDGSEGGGLDISQFTGGILGDMSRFGGQEHCRDCRCFISSLRELTSFAFSPQFPEFGLCYRANCFREEYLQVGIRNQLGGVSWYKCPDGGGKFIIAGFTGAFHCPDARAFCKMEEISGIKYPETDPLFELIFFSVLGGIILIFTCICCGPNWRNKMVAKTKRACGVTLFFHHSQDLSSDSIKRERPFAQVPHHGTGLGLLALNTFMTGIGLSIIGLGIYGMIEGLISTSSIPLLVGGSLISAISIMGMISGRKPSYGPSCCAAVYYYLALGGVLLVLWFIGYSILFPGSWDTHVEENIGVYTDMFPNSFDEDAQTPEQAKQIADTLRGNLAVIIGILAALFVFYSMNLVLLTKILEARNVVAMNYTFMNNASWVMGLVCATVGILFMVFQGTFAGEESIPIMLIVLGLFVFVTGVTGTLGAFKKSRKLIIPNLVLVFVVIALMVSVVVLAFLRGADVESIVSQMSEKEKRQISKDLGFASLSDEDLKENLRTNFRRFGMAFLVTTILFCVLFVSGLFFAKYVKHWNEVEAQKKPKSTTDKLGNVVPSSEKDATPNKKQPTDGKKGQKKPGKT